MKRAVVQTLGTIILVAGVSAGSFYLGSARADDADTTDTGKVVDTTDSAQAPAPITGGVVKVDVALSDLRDARLAIHRARKAAADLYDEMTRREMTFAYNPNVVGTILIMQPAPMAGPILPARKQWVDASMDQIGPIIKLFKQDIEIAMESHRKADVSEKANDSLAPLREQAFSTVAKSFETYKELERLTDGNVTYDQSAVASAARGLDKEMKELDKELKKGISILQKEAKAAKKDT